MCGVRTGGLERRATLTARGGPASAKLASGAGRTEDVPTGRLRTVCRNIKTLLNFEPPASEEEVRAASLQYVRKVTGFNNPSKRNEEAFLSAVEDVARVTERLLVSLETGAPPKDRGVEEAKARARSALRFGG